MKMNIDKAIEILKDYVELDRSIREGNNEGDFNSFCEEKCEAIESLIEYIFASRCAFKTSSAISKKVEELKDTNTVQLNEVDLKKTLACLGMAIYKIDDKYLTKGQRDLLIEYNSDLRYTIGDILEIEDCDSVEIDIETLEIKEYNYRQ